jgi:hypothetical protein
LPKEDLSSRLKSDLKGAQALKKLLTGLERDFQPVSQSEDSYGTSEDEDEIPAEDNAGIPPENSGNSKPRVNESKSLDVSSKEESMEKFGTYENKVNYESSKGKASADSPKTSLRTKAGDDTEKQADGLHEAGHEHEHDHESDNWEDRENKRRGHAPDRMGQGRDYKNIKVPKEC